MRDYFGRENFEAACTMTPADNVKVGPHHGGVDISVKDGRDSSEVLLSAEDTRRLRDYLTDLLGDAPTMPVRMVAGRTPTAIELAGMIRAEADDVLTRGTWTTGADQVARAVATALAGLAGRLEALR